MRICVLTTSYPRWPGDPSSPFVADLVDHLQAQPDTQITVLAPATVGARPSEGWGPRAIVRRLTYFWPARLQKLAYGDGIPWNLRRSRLAWVNIPFFLAAFAWAALTEGRRADIIHAQWGVLGAVATLLRPFHRRPVAVSIPGSDLASKVSLIRRVTHLAIRRADAVMTPSTDFWHACRELADEPDRCFCLLHGVPCPPRATIERLRRRKATGTVGYRIVTIGRLISDRRHDLLVRAVARVREQFPQVRLTVVGQGGQFDTLEALARKLGIADCVEMPGRVPSVDEYLLDADLYVSPTTVDAFGTAVVEAAAYGLPVVTTRVGFPAELVVEGQGGYVVPPADETALAEAILRVLRKDPDERTAMGWRMRDRVIEKELTWDISAKKVRRIFEDCIAEARR